MIYLDENLATKFPISYENEDLSRLLKPKEIYNLLRKFIEF